MALPAGYAIDTDPARLDRDAIHRFVAGDSYWARGRPREVMDRAIDNSLCFGLYGPDGALAGFARLVTDRATFAYVCDVFVLPAHRGRGLGRALVAAMRGHQELGGVRRWFLFTRDAHALYAGFGFAPLPEPDRAMTAGPPMGTP